jgi:O-methyltransferase involved in polyketide biosynthesis
MDKTHHNVKLTNEKATLLITLYAKALDFESERPILNDKKAYEIFETLDYDFSRLGKDDNSIALVRAKEIDDLVTQFIEQHKDAVVVYLGCGLDTRVSRINPASGIIWFDVDYPEVIDLRKYFYSDSDGYTMISKSLTDQSWLKRIPNDRATLVIAEGVLEYLTKSSVKTLLNRITNHFESGELVFDVMNSFGMRMGKSELKEQTGASHMWAVDDLRDIAQMDPKIRIVSVLSPFDSKYMSMIKGEKRKLYTASSTNPEVKNVLRILVYEF